MPSKRKFTAKFPTTKIKKIMQLDEEIGKVTATVPPVVSRAMEIFMENLISEAYRITVDRNSRTISPSCIKHAIERREELAFLSKLVADIPPLKSPPVSRRVSSCRAASDSISPCQSEDDLHGLRNGATSDEDTTHSKLKIRKRQKKPKNLSNNTNGKQKDLKRRVKTSSDGVSDPTTRTCMSDNSNHQPPQRHQTKVEPFYASDHVGSPLLNPNTSGL